MSKLSWSLIQGDKRHTPDQFGSIREDFLEEIMLLNPIGPVELKMYVGS